MVSNTVRTTHHPASQEEAEFLNDVTLRARIRRISWGAILAGVAIALVIMIMLNMLGLSIGAGSVDPNTEAQPAAGLATGAMIWVAASTLLSLFAGGYVAGHMSGLFYDADGVLHGLVTWAVVTLISLFAITSGVGSVVNGALNVASSALSAAGNVAGDVAPAVADALNLQNLTYQGIQADVRNMMQTAAENGTVGTNNATGGTTGATTEGTTDATTGSTDNTTGTTDTTDSSTGTTDTTAGTTGSTPMTNMAGAGMMNSRSDDASDSNQVMSLNEVMFNRSLSNLLMSDNPTQADRDNVISMLAANTGITEDEARAMVENWEQNFAQVRAEAEETARDAAQAATDAIAAFAGAMFAAMVVGAFAAGMGGMAGTPERHKIEIAGTTVTTP